MDFNQMEKGPDAVPPKRFDICARVKIPILGMVIPPSIESLSTGYINSYYYRLMSLSLTIWEMMGV